MAAKSVVRFRTTRGNDLRHLGLHMRRELPGQNVMCLRLTRLGGGKPNPCRGATGERNPLGVVSVVDVVGNVKGLRGRRNRGVGPGDESRVDPNYQSPVAVEGGGRSVFDDNFMRIAIGARCVAADYAQVRNGAVNTRSYQATGHIVIDRKSTR